jgi:hypothetical protein
MDSLNFKKIAIEDKAVFDHFFNSYLPKISEYTFTNLFIWSKPKNIEFAIYRNGLIMKACDREGRDYFLPPIGFENCEEILTFIMEYGRQTGIRLIELLPEFQKKYIKSEPFRITSDRNSFDYIYRSQSLASLKGWRLDGKRGFIRQFNENYRYEYTRYDKSCKKDCLDLYETWMGEKREIDKSINDEYDVFKEFLKNFEKLDSVGGLIYIEGKLAAFSFGERLNDTTFVIHFEKADTDYVGSFQVINQVFTQKEVLDYYPFVNREQDMGIEGLRKAKLSYAPFKLLKKYTVSF